MNFTVIDFETANRYRDSACAIGLVSIRNGVIKDTIYRLIRPINVFFEYRNIEIHGITAYDVENEPGFDEVYTELKAYFSEQLVVAHNAPFDIGVLKNTLAAHDIALPQLEYIDSVRLAKKLFPQLPNHKLNTLADYFGYQFHHHHALEDAEVTAKIVLDMLKQSDFNSLREFAESQNVAIKRL